MFSSFIFSYNVLHSAILASFTSLGNGPPYYFKKINQSDYYAFGLAGSGLAAIVVPGLEIGALVTANVDVFGTGALAGYLAGVVFGSGLATGFLTVVVETFLSG